MKAYTLRMEEDLMTALKEISIKEKKSLKVIILDALQNKIFSRMSKSDKLKEQKLLQRAAHLAHRLSDKDVLHSIREDRAR